MKKGKVHYYSEVSNGESKSSVTVYENGNMELRVEESQMDTLEKKWTESLNYWKVRSRPLLLIAKRLLVH